jgi:hypothetical protein
MFNQVLKYLGFTLVFCLLFGAGFYFGFKTSLAQNSSLTATKNDIKAIAETANKAENITSKEVDGVYFITPGNKPECPEPYKIKGKYNTSNTGIFYTTDNKNFEKVIPQLCFTTEDFAKSKGFLKKF